MMINYSRHAGLLTTRVGGGSNQLVGLQRAADIRLIITYKAVIGLDV
jgi:hypothetical protein